MKQLLVFFLSIMTTFCLSACNLPTTEKQVTIPTEPPPLQPTTAPTELPTDTPLPEPTITNTPSIVHKDLPGAPIGKMYQTVYDQVDEKTAPQKQAFGGDDFRNGKYERPFDQNMNYLPQVDLASVQLSREDPLWIYVLFKVDKPFSEAPSTKTHFMIELDIDLDNRGDYLITTGLPESNEWSTESVLVYSAPDLNIGGVTVVRPDNTLSEGRGYYEEIFNNGRGTDPDLAWSRLSKIDSAVAQIAFKNTLTGGEKGKFIWLPWTDIGMNDPSLFEYNDHFTFSQAGYPLKEDTANYPLKALWGVDNTCRVASGFVPTGTMPGLCPNYEPPPSKGPSSQNCVRICYVFGSTTVCTCQ